MPAQGRQGEEGAVRVGPLRGILGGSQGQGFWVSGHESQLNPWRAMGLSGMWHKLSLPCFSLMTRDN